MLSFNKCLCIFQKDGNDPESDHRERKPDQEGRINNETEIHPQEFISELFKLDEEVRENNETEPITGIKVRNEETDHAVAVPVLPIIIHNLES